MLDIRRLEHQRAASAPGPQPAGHGHRDHQPEPGGPIPMDLPDRVTVDPYIRQRARDKRQTPATEDHRHVQAVKSLQPVDLLA